LPGNGGVGSVDWPVDGLWPLGFDCSHALSDIGRSPG